jgi:hypothetical protein
MDLFFVCGAHTSGKTTILTQMEQDGDIIFRGSEIGKDLFYKYNFDTEKDGGNFEMKIAQSEIARDNEIIKKYTGIVGVETWHAGNMAYAAVRNPSVIPTLQNIALSSPLIDRAAGVWIVVGKSEIQRRTRTFHDKAQWASEFYEKVDYEIGNCLKLLNLYNKVKIIDGNQPLDIVTKEVKQVFNTFANPRLV